MGVGGSGALHITSPAAEVTVSGPLHFGPDSAFTCAAGATIRLVGPGAAVVNENPDPTDLPGLSGLALEFLPGEGGFACFEAASALDGGFVDNLALEALTLCSEGELVSLLRLVDDCDNGHRGAAGRECVFARSLWIEGESQLDLAGVRLYLEGDVVLLAEGWVAEERIVDSTIPPELIEVFYDPGNGWTEVMPEPATLLLLAAGACMGLRRRSRP